MEERVEPVSTASVFKQHHSRQLESRGNKQVIADRELSSGRLKFVIPCPRATANFPLSDLCVGRIDICCRCISSALFYSCGTRRNVTIDIVMTGIWEHGQHGLIVSVDGNEVRHLRPDEKNLGATIQRVLNGYRDGSQSSTSDKVLRGWNARAGRLSEALDVSGEHSIDREHILIYLCEKGKPLEEALRNSGLTTDSLRHSNVTVVIGDDRGLDQEEEEALLRRNAIQVCLGKRPLLTSQCIQAFLMKYDDVLLDDVDVIF